MEQKLVSFLYEVWSHLTDGARLKPGISRMRNLARTGGDAEFDAWFRPLRGRILERCPEGDRLALEWLSRPELFVRHKHRCQTQATNRFWLLAAWAARCPPEAGDQAMAAALESMLTSPRGQAYVYDDSVGLLALVDHLKAQTTPAEQVALGRRFLDILAIPSFGESLETFRFIEAGEGFICLDDFLPHLRQEVGQRLMHAFLPGVVAAGRASDREMAVILGRFDLSDVPLDPPDWAEALGRVSNQAVDTFLRTGEWEAMVIASQGRCAGLSAFLRLCAELESASKCPACDWSALLEVDRLLSQLQPPGPRDLEQAETVTRHPACELISGALLAPAWFQALEKGFGWSGLAEIGCWAMRYPLRLGREQRLGLWTEDLESRRMPGIVKAFGELPKAARDSMLAASSLPQVAGEGQLYLSAMAGLKLRRTRKPRPCAVFALALQSRGGLRPSECRRHLSELARRSEVVEEARLALRLWEQLRSRGEEPDLHEEDLLRELQGRRRPAS